MIPESNLADFQKELEHLINKFSMENASNTPDFMLAKYLTNCLRAWDEINDERRVWVAEKLYSQNIKNQLNK